MTKKTRTVGPNRDNPDVSFVEGLLTKKQFNRAWRSEGWSGDECDIEYGFVRKLARNRVRILIDLTEVKPGDKPCTFTRW